jgi:hypothetical protein
LEQLTPQEPQLAALVARVVSQPFVALPSQLPKPELHDPTEQTPEEQAAVAFGSEQPLPQAPQFPTLVCVLVSQPLDAMPSQSAHPATHVGTQAPAVQVVVPWALAQALPQAPQFDELVWRFVSQPLTVLPSQFPKPELHALSAQVPPLHVAVAFARLQATPQPPQSVRVLTLRSHPLFGLLSQLA